MMEATSKQCKEMHNNRTNTDLKTSLIKRNQFSSKSNNRNDSVKVQEEKQKNRYSDKKISRSSVLSSKGSIKELSKDEEKEKKTSMRQKFKAEPTDLTRWQFHSTKGCFYKEDGGNIESHHYQLKITQPTSVWITIKAVAPKYGKFNDDILDNDMTLFLMDDTPQLLAFSNSLVDGKCCLYADVEIGVYNLLTFSSGTKLNVEESLSGQVSLIKGTGDEARLTKACKDTLMEIFYRCDLDGNGYLSREEFNQFQMRSSGECCDDESWDVVKETIEVNPRQEITPNGFINLNLMEACDPEGGQDELWVTLETMGYSRKLILSKACPFQLELFTKRGKNSLSLIGVSDGGEPLRNAMNEAVKLISKVKSIKNKRDLYLHVAEFDQRITLAVENQSHSIVGVKIDCTGSENLHSDQGTLEYADDFEPKTMKVVHHLTPVDKTRQVNFHSQESIVR